MYTLSDGTPVIVESVHVVTDAESDYYGQKFAQVYCPSEGERDWMPAAELLETYYDWDNPDEDAQGSVLLTRPAFVESDSTPHVSDDSHLYQQGTGQGWGVQG